MSSISDSDNAKTLETYNKNVPAYVDDQPAEVSEQLQAFITSALSGLPKSAKILELGSGPGRDAEFIQSLGYHVETTDAAEPFIDYMLSRALNARKIDVLKDSYGGPYDLIYASALLLHFTDQEVSHILGQMSAALSAGGRIAIRTKGGDTAKRTDEKLGGPRYMHYFEQDHLNNMITRSGFSITKAYIESAGHDNKGIPWLHVLAQKESKS
jgi:hypothetical protein